MISVLKTFAINTISDIFSLTVLAGGVILLLG